MKKIIIIGLLIVAMPLSITFAQLTNSAPSKPPMPEVRDVAANPSAYVGRLMFIGVVGIVTPNKGFVLVDMKEYQDEGFGCLASDEPTKISVQWTGTVLNVKDKVRVEGQLTKEKEGYVFTAEEVQKQ